MNSIAMKTLAALAAAALSSAAVAGGKGGAAANANVGVGAGTGGAHMSANGQANTNGASADERKFGQDRAAARRSEQGTAHEQGSTSSANSKGPKVGVGGSAGAAATPPAKSTTE